jgi:hypothetical protein
MAKTVYHAYSVREYEKDGKGFDVVLEALPVNGRVSIRAPKEKDEAGE